MKFFISFLLGLIQKFLHKGEDLLVTRHAWEQALSREGHKWPPAVPQRENKTHFDIALRSKAQPNGCVCKNPVVFSNEPCTQSQIDAGCRTQTSESYAWGVTRFQHFTFVVRIMHLLYFLLFSLSYQLFSLQGSVSNIICQFSKTAIDTDDLYCAGDSRDYRPPTAYRFDERTNETLPVLDRLEGAHLARLNRTIGLRAAGNRNGVVLFAGPSRDYGSVMMFACRATNGEFLDSMEFHGANDVRKFTQDAVHDMYVGLSFGDGTGKIFRYAGSVEDPLVFHLVARLRGCPAELSFYYDKLLVGTWPIGGDLTRWRHARPGGLYLSPAPIDSLPAIVIGTDDAVCSDSASVCAADETTDWQRVWSISDYEPDPLARLQYGLSASVQVDEFVYWGTVRPPNLPTTGQFFKQLIATFYPGAEENLNVFQAEKYAHRPCLLLRGRYLGSDRPEIELLYGEVFLPVYNLNTSSWTLQRSLVENKVPLLGRSGFGNVFNAYLWSMVHVPPDKLLIGTFDAANATSSETPLREQACHLTGYDASKVDSNSRDDGYLEPVLGAGLFLLNVSAMQPLRPATWLSLDGLGNSLNYGIRNLVPRDEQSTPESPLPPTAQVMVGTADGFNTAPRSGWELLSLDARQ